MFFSFPIYIKGKFDRENKEYEFYIIESNDYTVIIIEGKFYTSEEDMYLVGGNMKKGLFENL